MVGQGLLFDFNGGVPSSLLRKCVLTSRDLKYDTCFDVVDGIFHGEENMILEDLSVLIL